jgi:hypothetical protein
LRERAQIVEFHTEALEIKKMYAQIETDHPLIKLTCSYCHTPDLGDTNEIEARELGWTEIRPVPIPQSDRTDRWWTHKGTCPECLKKIIARRKENQPMIAKVVRHVLDMTVIVAIIAGVVALIERPAAAEPKPAPPRQVTDIGGCCYSGGYADATSTRGDCADASQSPTGRPGLFVLGVFSDTDDDNAYCNALPGGD